MRRDFSYRNRFLVSFVVMIVLILLGSSRLAFFHINNETKITYSQLVDMIDRNQVGKIALFGNTAKVFVSEDAENADYIVYLTKDQSQLMAHLQNSKVHVISLPEQDSSIKYYLSGSILLIALVVLTGMLCSRILASNIRNKVDTYIDTFKETYKPALDTSGNEQLPVHTAEVTQLQAAQTQTIEENYSAPVIDLTPYEALDDEPELVSVNGYDVPEVSEENFEDSASIDDYFSSDNTDSLDEDYSDLIESSVVPDYTDEEPIEETTVDAEKVDLKNSEPDSTDDFDYDPTSELIGESKKSQRKPKKKSQARTKKYKNSDDSFDYLRKIADELDKNK